jgi:hypothetical protein
MKLHGVSRRNRRYLLIVAQLVLAAYMFQLAAIDHWHEDPTHVVGVEGSPPHVLHCHGESSHCSDSSGGFATFARAEAVSLPTPPAPRLVGADHLAGTPSEAPVITLSEPPKAA